MDLETLSLNAIVKTSKREGARIYFFLVHVRPKGLFEVVSVTAENLIRN